VRRAPAAGTACNQRRGTDSLASLTSARIGEPLEARRPAFPFEGEPRLLRLGYLGAVLGTMTYDELIRAVEHDRRYRVHFESRSPWTATVLIDGDEIKLYYGGPEAPPQTFTLVPDHDGHLVVREKPWGRLTKVTPIRVHGDAPRRAASRGAQVRAGTPGYAPHPERERRLASAVAVARFALESPDLYDAHRNELLSFACWWATELDGKYKTRFRSLGARRPGARDLRHEHVVPRKALRQAMQREPARAAEILREALGCVVTREEHDRLEAVGGQLEGWERYIAAGVDVFDEQDGKPLIESGRFAT
jgi:hypothetical protein